MVLGVTDMGLPMIAGEHHDLDYLIVTLVFVAMQVDVSLIPVDAEKATIRVCGHLCQQINRSRLN